MIKKIRVKIKNHFKSNKKINIKNIIINKLIIKLPCYIIHHNNNNQITFIIVINFNFLCENDHMFNKKGRKNIYKYLINILPIKYVL